MELIMAIVIIGIVASSVAVTLENVLKMNAEEQTIPVAALLGQSLMEEIVSKTYDEIPASPWTEKQNLGVDIGETGTDKSTFDDVDDFTDWQENPITDYPGYSSTVDIYYVNPDDLDTDPNIGATEYTDFKKITVTILYGGEPKISLVAVSQGY